MKKYIRNTLWIIFILIAVMLIAGASGWLWSLRSCEEGSGIPGSALLTGEIPAAPGGSLTAGVEFSLPLWQRIVRCSAVPGKGAAISGGTVRISSRWRWDRRVWHISATMRPYRTGSIPAGSIGIEISGRKGKIIAAKTEIPGFEVTSPDPAAAGGELLLADPAAAAGNKTPRRHFYYGAAAAAVILLLAALWIFLHRRRKQSIRSIPVWESTLNSLQELLNEVKSAHISPETGVLRLTDLMRHYLEKRFHLPATRRTTAEFLGNLQNAASPLNGRSREFLHIFMQAADLVKFARAAADTAMLADAAARAEELVKSTIPAENAPAAEGRDITAAPTTESGDGK